MILCVLLYIYGKITLTDNIGETDIPAIYFLGQIQGGGMQ